MWGGLAGGLHPPGLHLLNVAAHFAAAWLTGLLAAAWTRSASPMKGRTIPAALATALFAAFPFSRQAVAWPGALYNPLVSAMTAGAVLAYDRGRRDDSGRWIGVAVLLAALAPFCYETGLLVGPLITLTEGIGRLLRRWSRRSRWPLAFASLFLVTLALWRAMRGTGATGFGLNPPDLRRNAGYLVQGLIYPIAPLAQRLVAWQGIDAELGLWLVAAPTVALLAWSGLRRNRDAFWLGAAWFALFALPPVVAMKAEWFALAPRFLYMTAAGASLVWAAGLSAVLTPLRPRRQALVAGILLVALLAPAGIFVRDGMRLYAMAGETIWEAAEAATCGSRMLLVNLPLRIAPRGRTYPLGFEGITPLPARVTAGELVAVHTGIRDAAEAVAFGIAAVDDPPGYTYQLFGQPVGWEELAAAVRQTRAVYLTRYEPERIRLVEVGGAAIGGSAPGKPLARFGDRVALIDATSTCDEARQVHLTTLWQAEAPVKTDAIPFAHLLDSQGVLVAQADGHPLLGMLPFWLWEPGEAVRDVRHFEAVPPGEYTLRLGIWEQATGERWAAPGHADDAVQLPIRCP